MCCTDKYSRIGVYAIQKNTIVLNSLKNENVYDIVGAIDNFQFKTIEYYSLKNYDFNMILYLNNIHKTLFIFTMLLA